MNPATKPQGPFVAGLSAGNIGAKGVQTAAGRKRTSLVPCLILANLLSAGATAELGVSQQRTELPGNVAAMAEDRQDQVRISSTNGRVQDQPPDPSIRSSGGGLRPLAPRLVDEPRASLHFALVPFFWQTAFLLALSVTGIWVWTRAGLRRPRPRAHPARTDAEAEAYHSEQVLTHVARVSTLAEMAGSLAHEVNQPLSAILINAQAAQHLLSGKPVDVEEVREILVDIIALSRRAADMIGRMRVMLRKGETLMEPLDLNQIIKEVMDMIRSELLSRHVVASLNLGRDLPQVKGDRIQLQQVLMNLIVNACEAMQDCPAAQRRVTIRTALADATVEAAVSDCGPGFTPEMIEHPFTRFHSSVTDRLGMGLAICRTIMQAHGGGIWLANNDKEGATVGFRLPVHTETRLPANHS